MVCALRRSSLQYVLYLSFEAISENAFVVSYIGREVVHGVGADGVGVNSPFLQ